MSEDDYKHYIEKFGAEEGIADNWSWTEQADEVIRENLKKTTIMVPTADLIQLQQLGGDVYAAKNNLTASMLAKDETYRRYQNMSTADMYSALRDKLVNTGGYNTTYLRQMMNQ